MATIPDNPSGYYEPQYVNMQQNKAMKIETFRKDPVFIQRKKDRPESKKNAEKIEVVIDTKSNFNMSVYENAQRSALKITESMADITESAPSF